MNLFIFSDFWLISYFMKHSVKYIIVHINLWIIYKIEIVRVWILSKSMIKITYFQRLYYLMDFLPFDLGNNIFFIWSVILLQLNIVYINAKLFVGGQVTVILLNLLCFLCKRLNRCYVLFFTKKIPWTNALWCRIFLGCCDFIVIKFFHYVSG